MTLSEPFLQDSVLGLEMERWKVSASGDRVPPMLLTRKQGEGGGGQALRAFSAPFVAGLWEPAGGWKLREGKELC